MLTPFIRHYINMIHKVKYNPVFLVNILGEALKRMMR